MDFKRCCERRAGLSFWSVVNQRRKSSFTLRMNVGKNFHCEHQKLHTCLMCIILCQFLAAFLYLCQFSKSKWVNDRVTICFSHWPFLLSGDICFWERGNPVHFRTHLFTRKCLVRNLLLKIVCNLSWIKIEDFVPCMWLMQRAFFHFLLSGHKFLD